MKLIRSTKLIILLTFTLIPFALTDDLTITFPSEKKARFAVKDNKFYYYDKFFYTSIQVYETGILFLKGVDKVKFEVLNAKQMTNFKTIISTYFEKVYEDLYKPKKATEFNFSYNEEPTMDSQSRFSFTKDGAQQYYYERALMMESIEVWMDTLMLRFGGDSFDVQTGLQNLKLHTVEYMLPFLHLYLRAQKMTDADITKLTKQVEWNKEREIALEKELCKQVGPVYTLGGVKYEIEGVVNSMCLKPTTNNVGNGLRKRRFTKRRH
jgi:hypothetical protein